MAVLVVLLSVALIVALGFLLFGRGGTPVAAPSTNQQLEAESRARQQAQADAERRRKELDEQKAKVQELKDELKQVKRKLFEQKEGEKGNRDLAKARTEAERSATQQLEVVRAEFAGALAEIERLRAAAQPSRRAPVTAPAPVATPAPAAQAEPVAAVAAPTPAVEAAPAAKPERRFRELNDADREKMDRLEHEAKKERTRAAKLDEEAKRLKGRVETQNRIYNVTKGELDLVKDKYKALEKRLNRTLLETDLVRRALRDLEKKTGTDAARVTLTAEEAAASDQQVEARLAAEAAAQHARPAPAPTGDVPGDAPTETQPSDPTLERPVAQASGETESTEPSRQAAGEPSDRVVREPEA